MQPCKGKRWVTTLTAHSPATCHFQPKSHSPPPSQAHSQLLSVPTSKSEEAHMYFRGVSGEPAVPRKGRERVTCVQAVLQTMGAPGGLGGAAARGII